jgi:septum site-determining protein MinC
MPASLEIKASSVTLPVLKLSTSDIALIANQLQDKLQQAPDFFRHAPIVIEVESGQDNLELTAILDLLRTHDLVAVGIRGGTTTLHQAARAANLAVLADTPKNAEGDSVPAQTSDTAKSAKGKNGHNKQVKPSFGTIIEQPVRSGQRIYANDGDLIVLSHVSPGAEIMADGNIHVYGSLKGRAMAGVKGNTEARIFCSDLQAELVAIGGHYKISENLESTIQGKSVQVYLRNNSLFIKEL